MNRPPPGCMVNLCRGAVAVHWILGSTGLSPKLRNLLVRVLSPEYGIVRSKRNSLAQLTVLNAPARLTYEGGPIIFCCNVWGNLRFHYV